MTQRGGQLFVVHGRLESVLHDAAIVSTSPRKHFTDHWRPLLGATDPELGPEWESQGWATSVTHPRLWIANVVAREFETVRERIEGIVADVAKRDFVPQGKRVRPLLAMPVVGIGKGGFRFAQGSVIRALIDDLARLAAEYDLDIAIVTPEPSVYGALQYARRQQPTPLPPSFEAGAQHLGRLVLEGKVALFLGAGVSIPSGLLSWSDLLAELARSTTLTKQQLESLDVTDRAALIEAADPKGFQQRVAETTLVAEVPSLLHGLLAGLDCDEVVTTNYDLLYERAAEASGRDVASVMPWISATGADRWVLKLHGDVDHVKDIVLTRRHMVRYDALHRPSGALLQSLLLTRHLLVVGASLSDDNVVRLAHEVQVYRETHQAKEGQVSRVFGTVLDVSSGSARPGLWSGQLDWLPLTEANDEGGPRALEIFLDRVAVYAARDSSWLLDERFEGLLETDADRKLAANVRAVRAEIEPDDLTWAPLMRALDALGCGPQGSSSR